MKSNLHKLYYTIRNESEFRIIQVELLLAVEIFDYLCTFHIEGERPISCIKPLKKILSELPECFIQISRNCIINTRHVKSIDFKRREVKLTGNKIFYFSIRNIRILRKIFDK
jgi:DNA-binding LytR/AlgR family response regulator